MIKETAHLINYEVRDAHLLTENIALNHPTPKSKKTKDFTRLYKKRGFVFFLLLHILCANDQTNSQKNIGR